MGTLPSGLKWFILLYLQLFKKALLWRISSSPLFLSYRHKTVYQCVGFFLHFLICQIMNWKLLYIPCLPAHIVKYDRAVSMCVMKSETVLGTSFLPTEGCCPAPRRPFGFRVWEGGRMVIVPKICGILGKIYTSFGILLVSIYSFHEWAIIKTNSATNRTWPHKPAWTRDAQ